MDISSRLLMFLDVVERGSFANVAQYRGTDRSVISKQIGRLEKDLGVRLLNRSTRNFSLTAAGAEMVKKAETLRELLSDTLHVAEHYHSEPNGLLRIASASSFAYHYIVPVVKEFQEMYPQVEIELSVSNQLVNLVAEGYDVAFRAGAMRDSSLIARKLGNLRLLLCAAPSFIEKYGNPTSVEELVKLPASVYSEKGHQHDEIVYLTEHGHMERLKQNICFRSNDAEALLHHLRSGESYFFTAALLAAQDIAKGNLVTLLPDLPIPDYYSFYAVYPHRDLPARTRLFIEAVQRKVGQNTPHWENIIPGFSTMYGHGIYPQLQEYQW